MWWKTFRGGQNRNGGYEEREREGGRDRIKVKEGQKETGGETLNNSGGEWERYALAGKDTSVCVTRVCVCYQSVCVLVMREQIGRAHV